MVHFFDADIAKKYGVNAAVLACFLWDCIEQKSTESPQLHGGQGLGTLFGADDDRLFPVSVLR